MRASVCRLKTTMMIHDQLKRCILDSRLLRLTQKDIPTLKEEKHNLLRSLSLYFFMSRSQSKSTSYGQ